MTPRVKGYFLTAKLELFKDARHELVNELNNQEIFSYINDWLQQQIESN